MSDRTEPRLPGAQRETGDRLSGAGVPGELVFARRSIRIDCELWLVRDHKVAGALKAAHENRPIVAPGELSTRRGLPGNMFAALVETTEFQDAQSVAEPTVGGSDALVEGSGGIRWHWRRPGRFWRNARAVASRLRHEEQAAA